jgi:hypothetical protein
MKNYFQYKNNYINDKIKNSVWSFLFNFISIVGTISLIGLV